MQGFFFVDEFKNLAFLTLGQTRRIKHLLYEQNMKVVTLILADGQEEFLITEIEKPVHEALLQNNRCHITDQNEQDNIGQDYMVPVILTG